MDRGAKQVTVYGVTKSQTRISNRTTIANYQCCGSFRTAKGLRHTYTYIQSLPNSPPIKALTAYFESLLLKPGSTSTFSVPVNATVARTQHSSQHPLGTLYN